MMSETTNPTTVRNRDSLIQMFLDGTSGEVYNEGRLVTRETENGVELIAYGWNKIAEYNTESDTVTIFAGHAGNISRTVTRYVNLVNEIAGKRETRSVNLLADAAPNTGRPPAEAARFISNYKSFSGSDSSVEAWARRQVDSAVRSLV